MEKQKIVNNTDATDAEIRDILIATRLADMLSDYNLCPPNDSIVLVSKERPYVSVVYEDNEWTVHCDYTSDHYSDHHKAGKE